MASLTEQMEMLQKQQAILAEKIKEEEERKKKLAQYASIERLEALIEPITQHLDWVAKDDNSSSGRGSYIYHHNLSRRVNIMENFKRNKQNKIKYQYNQMLGNEEIFVTLLGIVKKQDARISELEALIKVKNNVHQGPHAGESWNYA